VYVDNWQVQPSKPTLAEQHTVGPVVCSYKVLKNLQSALVPMKLAVFYVENRDEGIIEKPPHERTRRM